MSNLPLTVKAPGKLMIAGEFAVLEPHYKLIVMAADRYVSTTVEESDTNTITLENFGLENIQWFYTDGAVTMASEDNRFRYTASALEMVCNYLQEQRIAIRSIHLTIKSELDDPSGKKYGLGSSAAVVTSVISAMLHAHLNETPDPKLVFKLAAVTHVVVQGNGSGADVAASAYGGFIEYVSFQADWLIDQFEKTTTLTQLIETPWEYLSIQPFKLPEHIHMAIGWTGSPASTGQLVNQILSLKKRNPVAYTRFLKASQEAVNAFIHGAQSNDIALLQQGVLNNRIALARVGSDAGVEIETHMLAVLSDLAEAEGGAGKSSGAGGGDCGIAFMTTKAQVDRLSASWHEAGIESLPLKMAPRGAAITNKPN
ncbi:phosphomevalonate kinase [Lentibacillus sp. JNUCC-1]|uniref:phosphomevalonate kinase n=1 Tax=Lentibacillus sp. JNUCC-1 TaxID=2654513 RepID=UPI002F915407